MDTFLEIIGWAFLIVKSLWWAFVFAVGWLLLQLGRFAQREALQNTAAYRLGGIGHLLGGLGMFVGAVVVFIWFIVQIANLVF